MSPFTDASACSLLPSSGSRGRPLSRSPAVLHLLRYYQLIRLLPALPVRLRLPLAHGTSAFPGSLWLGELRPLWGGGQASQVPGESFCPRAPGWRLRRPWTPLPIGRPSTATYRTYSSGTASTFGFGAVSSGPVGSLSTLHPAGHRLLFKRRRLPTKRKTRFRAARYGFARAGLSPAGSRREVSPAHLEFLLSQIYPGAKVPKSPSSVRVEEDPTPAVPASGLPPHRPERADFPHSVPQAGLLKPGQGRVMRGRSNG